MKPEPPHTLSYSAAHVGMQVESTWPRERSPATPPPQHGDGAWTDILKMTLSGWSLSDVLTIFEDEDSFTADWHSYLNDTCAPPAVNNACPRATFGASILNFAIGHAAMC